MELLSIVDYILLGSKEISIYEMMASVDLNPNYPQVHQNPPPGFA